MTTPASSGDGDRLNGWKEIAAHLGKGTRTAQRWEKDYGLPVHRVGREGGEIVFAFRDEIDRWARRTSLGSERTGPEASAGDEGDPRGAPGEMPSASERRPLGHRRAAAWIVIVVAAVAVAIGLLVLRAQRGSARPPEAAGPPAAWELSGGALTVRDAVGRQVFRHELGPAMAPVRFSSADPPERRAQARIEDLDGDGRPEVLVRVPGLRRTDCRLFCFESDGRVRFVDEPTGSVRFGDETFGDPWLAHAFFLTGSGPSRALYVSAIHNLWFPTRLRRLDPRGKLLSEYWSNGYVEFVDETVWRGRKVLLVAGVANDVRGGGLAIFDPPVAAGHAPSADANHLCRGCPAGGPILRLTFPTMCVFRRTGGIAAVLEAWVEAGDRLKVAVHQGYDRVGDSPGAVYVHYTIGPDLTVTQAAVSSEFAALHARLEKEGQLDHSLGPRDDADMFPVRVFDAAGVRELKRVAVSR